MMKILDIDPDSPLYGYVRPGWSLVSINGQEVRDAIDYSFKIADERVEILLADPNGEEVGFEFQDATAEEIGLTLDDRKIRFCKNNCIFCFVHQQPQGMRRRLYFKDEDYRLSFTHGNFVTLSNTTDDDIARIVEQRLSPMYVSVHATDDTLRRCMLKNERLDPIVPRLKQLADNGIEIHTQVVLCPGVNDGDQLERTIDELSSLSPGVQTLAVVPVGLTKYREKLPDLRTYAAAEAGEIIDFVESRQVSLLKRLGTRFVWPADEFYVAAGRDFPTLHTYEAMEQFENGIGMAREFITGFNRRKQYLKGLKSDRRALFLTGESAYPFLSEQVMPHIESELEVDMRLEKIPNRFWGETVTVSGLLTGQDLLRHASSRKDDIDTVVLPPNCLNDDDLFLDNLSLDHFRSTLGKNVVVGQYNLAETIREVYS